MPKILIVDDNEFIRNSLKEIFEFKGYETATAENGVEALQACQTESPEIVIMDIFMPLMDGLEAMRIIHKEHPEMKVIVISGGVPTGLTTSNKDTYLDIAENLGAAYTMQKPLGAKALLIKVRELLVA
jgi:CheY-like chemotaxis protein